MLFNSLEFLFVFLPIVYAVFWMLRTAKSRYVWLTIAGYVFYGWWDARFCLLMLFSTLVSFMAGLGFLRFEDERRRKLCLWIPIIVDLSLLGFFKYANFALHSFSSLSQALGSPALVPEFDIILPVGISFYTFHTITYVVDSYRRAIRPTTNFFEFAAFVSLFSQLVAGPIVRFRQIEGDFENIQTAEDRRWLGKGFSIFCVGLMEKILLADTLATFVDPALADYAALGTLDTWLVMVGYAFQLYFDFCGYSDMAIGLGLLFGLRIPINFNSPYRASDPADFWRRWHISLSTCLRDYLYIPLGGNRLSISRTYMNLMTTMLIGGLWHGANWTFVVWGAYHGALLAGYRRFAETIDAIPLFVRRALTFLLVVIGWVFFRATDFTMARVLLQKMAGKDFGRHSAQLDTLWFTAPLLLAALAAWGLPNSSELHQSYRWSRWKLYGIAAALGVCVAMISGGRESPFLYFQF